MSTMLATTNPEAVARMADTRPLPGVGDLVIYYPRPGEVQRGRTQLPALVMAVDADNRLLELVIIRGVDDWLEQTNVPERKGEDRGWERRDMPAASAAAGAPIGAQPAAGAAVTFHHAPGKFDEVHDKIDALRKAIFGTFEQPDKSVLELIDALDERVDRAEKIITVAPVNVKSAKAAKAAKPAKKAKKRGK